MTSPHRRVWVHPVMGTVASVHAYGTPAFLADPDVAESVAQAFEDLLEQERIFSTYREDSDISRLRRGEWAMDDVHPLVSEVAAACEVAERSSGGLFSSRWRGWFDPTGYVKGWAVERAARERLLPLLTRTGATAIGITVGGDMQLGTAIGTDWVWPVGIADPHRPGSLLATVEIVNGAVATSGTAERGAHIIDPRTGETARGIRSATVIADSLTSADLWATVAVVAGDDTRWVAQSACTAALTLSDEGACRRWIGGTEVSVVAGRRDAAPGAL